MTDTVKHTRQLFTDFFNSLIYFNLVSCSSKIQVPYFILDKGCDRLKLDTSAERVIVFRVRSFNLSQALRQEFFCLALHNIV